MNTRTDKRRIGKHNNAKENLNKNNNGGLTTLDTILKRIKLQSWSANASLKTQEQRIKHF